MLEHARRLQELLRTRIRARRRIQGRLERGPTLGIENEVAPVRQRLSVAHAPRVGPSFVGAHHSLKTTLQRSGSRDALAFRGLSLEQKRLDQLTLAAHGQTGKALVPLTLGHIGLRVEPCREQLKLRRRNLPALNAFEQLLKQRGRKILSADLRHGCQMP